jgi:hypothetical protein
MTTIMERVPSIISKQNLTAGILLSFLLSFLYFLGGSLVYFLAAALIVLDFWSLREIFRCIKIWEHRLGMQLQDLVSPIFFIFSWMLYAFLMFSITLSVFKGLELPGSWMKWIFPIAALKSVYFIYQIGKKVKVEASDHLNTKSLQVALGVHWAFIMVVILLMSDQMYLAEDGIWKNIGQIGSIMMMVLFCCSLGIPLYLWEQFRERIYTRNG